MFIGGHVLQVCAEAATIEAAVSLGHWCFFSLAILFALRHAFQGFIVRNVHLGCVGFIFLVVCFFLFSF